MKTIEEYLDDYFDKQNELSRKGELWRLRITPKEFIKEVERIKAEGIEAIKRNCLTEYHIQRKEECKVSILLMNTLTIEEISEQFDRLRKEREKYLAEEAPEIQKEIELIQTPLFLEEIKFIFKALWYKQITIEMLSKPVFNEFKETYCYQRIVRRNEKKST